VSLLEAGFVAIRSISDAVSGDGAQQFVIQARPVCGVFFALERNRWLKCFQGLNGTFEVERTWFEMMLLRGLGQGRIDDS